MTLYEFRLMDEHHQAEAVWEHGVHLDTRATIFHTVGLYQLKGFYVEVFYNKAENKIAKIRSFISINPLEPYLNRIDVTSLIKE